MRIMLVFPVIKIKGKTPYERGESYGSQAAPLISLCIETYKSKLLRQGTDWATAQIVAMKYLAWAGEKEGMNAQVEEISGIAIGSGHPVEDIAVLNSRYELLHCPGECTAFALSREATVNKHVIVGQNWDQDPSYIAHTVLLDITEEETGTKIFGMSEAGQLIRSGLAVHKDGSATAICNNSILSSIDHVGIGCPGNVLRRKVLTMNRMEAILNIVTDSARTVSNNIVIGTTENKVVDVELLPQDANTHGKLIPIDPYAIIGPTGGVIAHDNSITSAPQLDMYRHGHPRGTHLKILLAEQAGSIDIEYIKKCMSNHEGYPESICSHGDAEDSSWQTIASVIYDLDDKKAYVCCGPPCENPYMEFEI